jgi:hypothetical protein
MSAFVDLLRDKPAIASTTTPTQMPSFDDADAQSMQGIQGYGATTGAQAARPGDPMAAYSMAAASQSPTLRKVGLEGTMSLASEQAKQRTAQAQQNKYMGILSKAQTPQDAIAAGVPIDTVKGYYESKNFGRTEAGRPIEVEGVNGEKMIQQVDKFGQPMGAPMPGYMPAQAVNTGDKTIFAKPLSGQSFGVNMSPGDKARLDQSAKQFQQSETRQANQFAQTQNAPVFNAEAGGFVYKPTAQAPQGGVVKVAGLPDKPLNETQGNATAFGLRMAEADKLLNTLEAGGTTSGGLVKGAVEGTLTSIIPYQGEALAQGAGSIMNTLPNWLGGPNENQQNYAQAKENFITANLRKESGAAIGQGEFVREDRKYFPQAGDSPAVLAQKQKARQTAIQAMKIQAGPGSKNIEAKNPSTGTAAPTSSGW